jgi:6-phosphogluconolactonase
VKDGVLAPQIQLLKHTGFGLDKARQEGPHVHQCVFRPGKNELFVCDLGIDQVVVYAQDPETGLLSLQEVIKMPGGMGPRHLVFKDPDCFYVTGELDNMVRHVVYRDGWQIAGQFSTLPGDWAGESFSGAIRFHNNSLWISNRGHDSLCTMELDETGAPSSATWMYTGGKYPRDFALLSDGIVFAHQTQGGIILSTGTSLPLKGTVCVCPESKGVSPAADEIRCGMKATGLEET